MPIWGEKYDIFLKTDINFSGGPLLNLKYSMKKSRAHEFISKSQVNYAISTNNVKWEGLHHWMEFFHFEISRTKIYSRQIFLENDWSLPFYVNIGFVCLFDKLFCKIVFFIYIFVCIMTIILNKIECK